MNDKPTKRRKPGARLQADAEAARPRTEWATADLIFNAPREVKEVLRDINRKRNVVKENDAPEAA